MTHLKEGQWLCNTGEGRVPALAFGTSGISADLTQHSVFSALQDFVTLTAHLCMGTKRKWARQSHKALCQGLLRRDEVFGTTKLLCTHQDPQDVLLCLQQSLRDLQLGYVDLFLIHWPLKFR